MKGAKLIFLKQKLLTFNQKHEPDLNYWLRCVFLRYQINVK
jgi:hypothetical protein